MNSGLKPLEEDILSYNNLKMKAAHKYLIFDIVKKGDSEVLHKEHVGDKDATWESMCELLPRDDCRYVIVDFVYENFENPPRKESRIVLVLWCPDSAKTFRKFPFASSKDNLKSSFTGIQKELQAGDKSQLDFETVRKEFGRK